MKNIEKATAGRRGFDTFPQRWGVPPVTDTRSREFEEWVRTSIIEHELRGSTGSARLQERRGERSKLAAPSARPSSKARSTAPSRGRLADLVPVALTRGAAGYREVVELERADETR